MIFDFTTLQNRRNRAAKKLADVMGPKDLLLVYAGEPIQRPGGLDQTYSYQPHPNYYWLSGRRRVSGVMTFSQSEGWQDYTKPHAPEETLWEGTTPDPQAGRDIAELATSLKSHQKIIPIGQVPAELFNHPKVASREERFNLQVKFEQARRIKDAAEIELIENIARIANRGYERIQAILKPGITEREIRIEYEAEIQRAGSLGIPYGTIVGTGSNAAILHAEPSSRMVAPDDLVLIDAGAEIHDYCVDITRVYPASGKFDSKRQAIYDTVKKAQAASIALMKPDVEWKDVHAASARVIAQGLRDLGILNCSADEALASGAVSVFFPHGVGHLVGLRVRDTGH
ncbi:MAG: M24 family metallopeptidase, partial [Proteobacteria bacterium]